jgi:hypothetical protein
VITPSAPQSETSATADPLAGSPKATFSGSKFGSIASPRDFAPPRSPAPSVRHALNSPFVPKSPPARAPYDPPPTPPSSARNSIRPLPPPEYIPPNAPANPAGYSPAPSAKPTARAIMPGSKSSPFIGPESFAPTTANRPYTPQSSAPQSQQAPLPQKGAVQQPSPQQSLKKAVNSWINPTNQRAASR